MICCSKVQKKNKKTINTWKPKRKSVAAYALEILEIKASHFCFSIAMATKENLQSQKGALNMISQKMNTLASILSLIDVEH